MTTHLGQHDRADEDAGRRAQVASDSLALNEARKYWHRVAGNASTDEDIAAAADRLCFHLEDGLSRWIGIDGYRTLQDRAVHEVIEHHRALMLMSFAARDEAANLAAVKAHGADEFAAGMVAFVAAVIDLLGRIIGTDMALRLVEHWGGRARTDG